jgi:hypothetical protein
MWHMVCLGARIMKLQLTHAPMASAWSALFLCAAVACTGADEAGEDRVPANHESGSGASAGANTGGEGAGDAGSGAGATDAGGAGQGGEPAETLPASNDCCADAASPGCSDGSVESCVCAIDDYCCTTAWDAACVGIATNDCGACGGGAGGAGGAGGGSGGGVPPDDCAECILQDCNLGCILDGTCTTSFDVEVFTCLVFECGDACWGWTPPDGCPGSTDPCGGGCGCSGGGGSTEGSCCGDNATPGCIDDLVEACVCAADSYCCTTAWDAQCAAEVDSFGCGTCF